MNLFKQTKNILTIIISLLFLITNNVYAYKSNKELLIDADKSPAIKTKSIETIKYDNDGNVTSVNTKEFDYSDKNLFVIGDLIVKIKDQKQKIIKKTETIINDEETFSKKQTRNESVTIEDIKFITEQGNEYKVLELPQKYKIKKPLTTIQKICCDMYFIKDSKNLVRLKNIHKYDGRQLNLAGSRVLPLQIIINKEFKKATRSVDYRPIFDTTIKKEKIKKEGYALREFKHSITSDYPYDATDIIWYPINLAKEYQSKNKTGTVKAILLYENIIRIESLSPPLDPPPYLNPKNELKNSPKKQTKKGTWR